MTSVHLRRLSIVVATVLGSVTTSALLLLLDPVSWQSREYIAMAVWSLPLSAFVLGGARIGRRVLRRWGLVPAALAVPVLAFMAALVWVVLVYAGTGQLILGAFDANPLWSWVGGALCGLVVGTAWRDQPVTIAAT